MLFFLKICVNERQDYFLIQTIASAGSDNGSSTKRWNYVKTHKEVRFSFWKTFETEAILVFPNEEGTRWWIVAFALMASVRPHKFAIAVSPFGKLFRRQWWFSPVIKHLFHGWKGTFEAWNRDEERFDINRSIDCATRLLSRSASWALF